MTLQNIIINEIDHFCGTAKFLENLKIMQYNSSQKCVKMIDNIINYYRIMFSIELDHEKDIINYSALREISKEILIHRLETGKCQDEEFTMFFIELIEFGDDYVSKVRLMSS